MNPTYRRARAVYSCETLESRCLFDAIELIPEVQSLIDNDRLRRAGRGFEVEGTQVIPPEDAPPLAGTVEAVNFDGDATASQFYHIPPDTHGAVGPNHIVNVVNTTIQWFTKAGVLQNTQRLGRNTSTAVGSFFAAQSPVNGLFDPRVMYDQYNSRFVVVALEQRDTAYGDPVNSSRVLVAVSDDSDPNGTWFTTAINSNIVISGTARWADFPQVGIDANAIFISGNMFGYGFGSYAGSRLWIVNKTGLYSGGAVTQNVYDPATLSGISTGAFSLQPTHMYGTTPGSTGTFLINSSFTSGANELLSIIRVDNPTAAPTFTNQYVNLGDVDNGASVYNVPQSGTATTVAGGDRRLMDAVWRNNSLYTVNTISPGSGTDANTATVRWHRVNTTNLGALTLADSGIVSGEDIAAGTRTFYPSISVDQNNNVGIGFSASGPSIFPGSYYTGRLSSDAAGTVQSSGVVAAGQAFYIRTFGGGSNRWGDYSAIALDPADNSTFWTYNLYALTQGTNLGSGELGRWGTRWGKFQFSSTPAAPSTPDLAAASDSGISSTDNVTNDNTPTFTGTAEAGSTVTIFANGVNVGSGVAAGGSYSITTSALANNTFNINATATNGSGSGPLSGSLSVTIDTVAPVAPSTPDLANASDSGSSNSDNYTNITTPTFTGTAEANSLVQIFVDGIGNNTGAAAGGAYSIATAALASGVRSITARASDTAGNVGVFSSPLAVTIDTTAPTASPATFNYLTGGTTFTIPFSENVNTPALITSDFTVQNLTTLAFIPAGNMTIAFNGGTNVATIGFVGGVIPNGIYQINVVAAGVTDQAGNVVGGTLSTGPNFFQQADANRDRAVNTVDFNILAGNFGTSGNWAQGNFNYLATIDSVDFNIFLGEYGKKLPPTPGPVASPLGQPSGGLFSADNVIEDGASLQELA
jgi:hypothetical protein